MTTDVAELIKHVQRTEAWTVALQAKAWETLVAVDPEAADSSDDETDAFKAGVNTGIAVVLADLMERGLLDREALVRSLAAHAGGKSADTEEER